MNACKLIALGLAFAMTQAYAATDGQNSGADNQFLHPNAPSVSNPEQKADTKSPTTGTVTHSTTNNSAALPSSTNTVQTMPVANTNTNMNANIFSLKDDKDKLSYTIGVDMGQNFKQQQIEVNPQAVYEGLKDAINGNSLLISKQEMEQTLQAFQKQLSQNRESQVKQEAEKNLQSGNSFLNENKSKKGIVALPSGLQYKIISAGNGAKPSEGDTVTVEYTGKLLDGTVFDSTDKMGKPVTFRVSDVIPGWTEALQLMPAGSAWEVYIPAKLAYGEQGISGLIGPNEALVFNIHLLSVKKTEGQKNQKTTTTETTTKASSSSPTEKTAE